MQHPIICYGFGFGIMAKFKVIAYFIFDKAGDVPELELAGARGLAAAGVEPVLIKGTALAYSLYPDAGLRTRADTDLIIPAVHLKTIRRSGLGQHAFEALRATDGSVFADPEYQWSIHVPRKLGPNASTTSSAARLLWTGIVTGTSSA